MDTDLSPCKPDRGAPGGPYTSPFPFLRSQAPVCKVRMPWGRDWPACLSVGVSKGADVLSSPPPMRKDHNQRFKLFGHPST